MYSNSHMLHTIVSWKTIFLKKNLNFFCIYLSLKKLINKKYFSIQKKLTWFLEKYCFYFRRKTLFRSWENLEMSCYLFIISNLILKLLIAIYFILNLFFLNFIPYNLIFISTLILIFIIVICFFSYH